jgi:hypothetical protein
MRRVTNTTIAIAVEITSPENTICKLPGILKLKRWEPEYLLPKAIPTPI